VECVGGGLESPSCVLGKAIFLMPQASQTTIMPFNVVQVLQAFERLLKIGKGGEGVAG
jgi:hypothetical protein